MSIYNNFFLNLTKPKKVSNRSKILIFFLEYKKLMTRNTYFASKANANTPAASGAAADVPECVVVHFPYKSVVACKKNIN